MADALFRKILVPVDFSSCSEVAFRVALQLGHVFGSAIILIHVIDVSAIAAFNRLGRRFPRMLLRSVSGYGIMRD